MAMFGKSRRGQSESTTESMRLWKEKNFKQTSDVFFAPEWFPQSGVQLIWPTDDTDWKYMLSEVTGYITKAICRKALARKITFSLYKKYLPL